MINQDYAIPCKSYQSNKLVSELAKYALAMLVTVLLGAEFWIGV